MDVVEIEEELKQLVDADLQSNLEDLCQAHNYQIQDLQQELHLARQELCKVAFHRMQDIEAYCGFLALLSISGILPQKEQGSNECVAQ